VAKLSERAGVSLFKVYSELSEFFNFRYNISFIDPPLRGFGDISLSDDIFLGAKPLGKYHHFGKYYAEYPSLRVYK
jgi:hypothetical protein